MNQHRKAISKFIIKSITYINRPFSPENPRKPASVPGQIYQKETQA